MAVAAPPGVQYKTLPIERVSVKAAGGGAREFTGYASRWDDLDWMGDIVKRGAFAATLRQRATRPLLWNHDSGVPIGYELELAEDAVGLKGTWKLSGTPAADDAYTLLRDGAVSGLSIGFYPVETRDGPDGTRELVSVELFEISIVAVPALDSARVLDVKSARGAATMSVAQRMAARGLTPLPAGGSLGQKLVSSSEYKRFAAGSELKSEHGSVRLKVELADVSLLAQKALAVSFETSPVQAIDSLSDIGRPALLLDLLPTIPTIQNVVQVVRQTAAPGAAAVAEATATTGTSGTKQETGLSWEDEMVPVETISEWVPVTRSILADAASFQGLLDGELTYATRLAAEAQVLTGNGTRPNLQGIGGLAGVNAITAGADPLAAIAEGISKARKLGRRQPNVIVMDADVWEALSMARESTVTGNVNAGGSLLGPPGLLGRPSLFGLPVIPSSEAAAGTAYIGATFTAPYYERLGATIVVGTIGTMFIRNIVAVRCEIRGALGVTRPPAWSVVTGLPT